MKKLYFSILTVIAGTSAFAQAPNITSANLPVVGSVFNWLVDTGNVSNLVMTPAGPSQTWNYASSITPNVVPDVETFVSPSGLQGASSFPSSNLAQAFPADSANQFYVTNTNGLYLDGVNLYSTAGFGIVDFNPNQRMIPTPVTYNSSIPNDVSGTIINTNFMGFNLMIKRHTTTIFAPDAHGSLVTPAATYPSVLRLKATIYNLDSVFLLQPPFPPSFAQESGDTTINYYFLQNGTTNNSVVMIVGYDGSGQMTQLQYLAGPSSVNNLDASSFAVKVYPNPAGQTVNFKLPVAEPATISIYDISGKKIMEIGNRGYANVPVHIADLTSGFYFYTVQSASYSKSGKFVKE